MSILSTFGGFPAVFPLCRQKTNSLLTNAYLCATLTVLVRIVHLRKEMYLFCSILITRLPNPYINR